MSGAELIEQLKALPPTELEVVRNYLLNGVASTDAETVKYLDPEKARALGAKVMEENADLFRKLAQ